MSSYTVAADINLLLGFFDVDTLHRLSARPIEKCSTSKDNLSPVVLVRYSIYRSIAILVNVRYRYLVVSRYFDISNESMISQTILGRYTSIEYRMKYRVS